MTRARTVAWGLATVIVVGGIFAVLAWRAAARHSWQAQVASLHIAPGPVRAKSQRSAAFWAMHDRVSGDLLQRPSWGRAELEELRGYIAAPVDWAHVYGPIEARTVKAENEYLMWSEAVSAIGARLHHKAPIDNSVRPAFEAELTALLTHEAPAARNTGIAFLTEIGLLDHPGPVRSKVEAMRTDPDPAVAANAIRQLEWRDLLVQKGMVK